LFFGSMVQPWMRNQELLMDKRPFSAMVSINPEQV